jgi:hypothetical protein
VALVQVETSITLVVVAELALTLVMADKVWVVVLPLDLGEMDLAVQQFLLAVLLKKLELVEQVLVDQADCLLLMVLQQLVVEEQVAQDFQLQQIKE